MSIAVSLVRPLDTVEAQIVFEAGRLRQGLPLFVDPLVGHHEYGSVATRHYVLYTPVWPAMLSVFPPGVDLVVGRALSIVAWFGALLFCARSTDRARRPVSFLVALACGGLL